MNDSIRRFNLKTAVLLGAALSVCLLSGCASSDSEPQRPPSAVEQRFFDVTTNVADQVVTTTNEQGEPVITTNRVETYVLTPNTRAGAIQGIGATAGSFFGVGGAVGTALGALFGLWGLYRSRQSTNTSQELAQIIETGRQILRSLPDGAKYEAAWKDWMVKHQAETGSIAAISALVAEVVDNDSARGAAEQIIKLIESANQPAK